MKKIIISLFLFLISAGFCMPAHLYNSIKENIIKYILIINPKVSYSQANEMARAFIYYSKKYQIGWEILVCIAKAESHFNIQADSGVAAGIMQVNYRFWNIDKNKLKKNIWYSINVGAYIVKETFNLVDRIYNKYCPNCEIPLYKYFLVYHGGTRRVFAKKLTRRERIYIRNIYNCLDYFDKIRYVKW